MAAVPGIADQPLKGHLARIEKEQTSAWMAASAQNSVFSHLRLLFETGEHSDLVILRGGEEFRVHKAVVCPQCPFFDAAVRSGFKEAYEGVIALPDDDPRAIRSMLAYLYTLSYSWQGSMTEDDWSTAILDNSRLYVTAEKYSLMGLKTLVGFNIYKQLNFEQPHIVTAVLRELFTCLPDATADTVVKVIVGKCLKQSTTVLTKHGSLSGVRGEAVPPQSRTAPFLKTIEFRELAKEIPEIKAMLLELSLDSYAEDIDNLLPSNNRAQEKLNKLRSLLGPGGQRSLRMHCDECDEVVRTMLVHTDAMDQFICVSYRHDIGLNL